MFACALKTMRMAQWKQMCMLFPIEGVHLGPETDLQPIAAPFPSRS